MSIPHVIGVNPLQTTLLQLGIVSGRVALLLRSTEIHPVLLRFVIKKRQQRSIHLHVSAALLAFFFASAAPGRVPPLGQIPAACAQVPQCCRFALAGHEPLGGNGVKDLAILKQVPSARRGEGRGGGEDCGVRRGFIMSGVNSASVLCIVGALFLFRRWGRGLVVYGIGSCVCVSLYCSFIPLPPLASPPLPSSLPLSVLFPPLPFCASPSSVRLSVYPYLSVSVSTGGERCCEERNAVNGEGFRVLG